tara:strand:+ start:259 stop:720 length:462 start_codon:yes stop_codon:yes gene_type:complete
LFIHYKKLREGAKAPARANPSDAGADLFYCPKDPAVLSYSIIPGTSVLIPTGLKIAVPHGYMLEIKNKSGIASKKKLIVGACVVDSGYEQEIFVNLHNIGRELQVIESGQKIAQMILVPIIHCGFIENKEKDLYKSTTTFSERSGGFGSTGKF